jgi:hypothetical protein
MEGTLRMNRWLLLALGMFVNLKFTIVLDAGKSHDKLVGDCLVENGYSVLYEELPPKHDKLFHGTAFGGNYARSGYDRQQWSKFYLDYHTMPT